MSNGMTRYEIFKNIDSGKFVFQPEDIEDVKKVVSFQAVVNLIKLLENGGMVKVFEYRPSKNFSHNTPVLIDRIIVENLTLAGEYELKRLIELENVADRCV